MQTSHRKALCLELNSARSCREGTVLTTTLLCCPTKTQEVFFFSISRKGLLIYLSHFSNSESFNPQGVTHAQFALTCLSVNSQLTR